MPYTLAHPAFVLPLRRVMPQSALVAGSVAPDLPLWLRLWGGAEPVSYRHTHSAVGVLGVDLAVGIFVVVVWVGMVRGALLDAVPSRHTTSQHPVAPRPVRVCAGVLVGASIHVLIDEFTHPGRWGSRNVGWLASEHSGLLGTKWMQYSLGLTGVAVLAVALVRWLCGRDLRFWRTATSSSRARSVWIALGAGVVVAVVDAARWAVSRPPSAAAVTISVRAVTWLIVALVLGSSWSTMIGPHDRPTPAEPVEYPPR